jgi:hypothetical protein
VPDVAENFASVVLQERSEFAIRGPGAGDGALEYFGGAREIAERRDVSQGAVEAHVSLALLLGIIKRMRVQKRPDELAADVFEAKLKMRVLINGVMAGEEGGRADGGALLVGDFLGRNQARRIAGARSGDGRVVRMREGIAQRDARDGRLDNGLDRRCGVRLADPTRGLLADRLGSLSGSGGARRRALVFILRSGWRRRGYAPRRFYTAGMTRNSAVRRIGIISFWPSRLPRLQPPWRTCG